MRLELPGMREISERLEGRLERLAFSDGAASARLEERVFRAESSTDFWFSAGLVFLPEK